MFFNKTQQCFAFKPQTKFPAYNLNFTESEGDEIKSRLPFKIFSTLPLSALKIGCAMNACSLVIHHLYDFLCWLNFDTRLCMYVQCDYFLSLTLT